MDKTWVWPEAQSHQWIVKFGGRFLIDGLGLHTCPRSGPYMHDR